MKPIINTRADLDALKNASDYGKAMDQLKASMTAKVDAAIYPDGYGQPGYDGAEVAAAWEEMETLDTIERLGFTKAEFLAAYDTAAGQ